MPHMTEADGFGVQIPERDAVVRGISRSYGRGRRTTEDGARPSLASGAYSSSSARMADAAAGPI